MACKNECDLPLTWERQQVQQEAYRKTVAEMQATMAKPRVTVGGHVSFPLPLMGGPATGPCPFLIGQVVHLTHSGTPMRYNCLTVDTIYHASGEIDGRWLDNNLQCGKIQWTEFQPLQGPVP